MDSGRESSVHSYEYGSSADTLPAPGEISPKPRRRNGPNPRSQWKMKRFEGNAKPLYYGFNTLGSRRRNQLRINDIDGSDFILAYIVVHENDDVTIRITDEGPRKERIVIWRFEA